MSSEGEQNDESSQTYVIQLKDTLKAKSIGSGIDFEDKFLIKFLRSRNYQVDETCEIIKNYLSLFKKYPNFFEGIDPLKKLYEGGVFCELPERNVTGECVTILRAGVFSPWNDYFRQVVWTTVYAFELAELHESTQKNGVIEIIDCAGVGLRHFLKFGISEIMLGVEMTEKSLPIRWSKICVVNENAFVDIVWSIARPFMSKHMRDTFVFVGSDMKKLHEFVSPEILPPIYGGTSEKYDSVEYFQYLKNNEPDLIKLWQPFKLYHEKN